MNLQEWIESHPKEERANLSLLEAFNAGRDSCLASPAKNAESGSNTGRVLPMLAPEDLMIRLIAALEEQSQSIQALADSNLMLVQAMSEDMGNGDMPATTYMDGSPVR